MCAMTSPTAVAAAVAAGEGATLSVSLGGVRDTEFSAPPMPVQVSCICFFGGGSHLPSAALSRNWLCGPQLRMWPCTVLDCTAHWTLLLMPTPCH